MPERDAQETPCREQFADGEVTRGRKFEGVWGTDEGVYVVNSYAWEEGDMPADASPHDGMVWFYDYKAETIQLVTYFPHQTQSEDDAPAPKYSDLTFDGPDNVTVTPWGSLVLAEDGTGASHVLGAFPGGPAYAIARNDLTTPSSVGPSLLARRQGPLRQHAGPRLHPGHHRPVGALPRLRIGGSRDETYVAGGSGRPPRTAISRG